MELAFGTIIIMAGMTCRHNYFFRTWMRRDVTYNSPQTDRERRRIFASCADSLLLIQENDIANFVLLFSRYTTMTRRLMYSTVVCIAKNLASDQRHHDDGSSWRPKGSQFFLALLFLLGCCLLAGRQQPHKNTTTTTRVLWQLAILFVLFELLP